MPFRPRIAIIGAGPSGLALGQLLHQRGIHATIYELRAEPTATELAKPSGMLDLHEESGLTAIRECGLWKAFQDAVGDCSESMRVLNRAGEILHSDEGELSSRPEIPRNALTQLLIQHLPASAVKWNHKLAAVRSARHPITSATEITLDFGATGTSVYDFVIGADGAWSCTRTLVSDAQPIYSGAQYLTATMRHVTRTHPHLAQLSGTGSLCALGGGNGIMTQRGPQDSIRIYAAMSTPLENFASSRNFQHQTAAQVSTNILRDESLFAGWAPQLQDLLAATCEAETADNPGAEADIRPYYMLPVGLRWEHRAGVTLMGDAAHLMTPWAGEGVNLALWDALDLARVLAGVVGVEKAVRAEAGTAPGEKDARREATITDAAAWQAAADPAVREYEETMLARAQEKAEETARNKDMFLSEDGAEKMAGFFQMYEDMAAAAAGGNASVDSSSSVDGAATVGDAGKVAVSDTLPPTPLT